jgi:hypothetical protein
LKDFPLADCQSVLAVGNRLRQPTLERRTHDKMPSRAWRPDLVCANAEDDIWTAL